MPHLPLVPLSDLTLGDSSKSFSPALDHSKQLRINCATCVQLAISMLLLYLKHCKNSQSDLWLYELDQNSPQRFFLLFVTNFATTAVIP